MKKSFYTIPLLLFAMHSCDYDSKLNLEPPTLISDVTAFETVDRVNNQINGLYGSFKGTGFWGSNYIYFSEARAGNFVSATLNPTRAALTYQMLVDASASEVDDVWVEGYQIINACNLFLDRLAINGEELLGATTYQNYVAEARFLRSITYYYLLQMYAQPYLKDSGASPGLPLRLEANTGLKDYNMPRSTVAQIYEFVLGELEFAEQNLPDSYPSAILNTTRAHRNTAIAMKTNVYLAMGDYPAVIAEADKLVPVSAPYRAPSGVSNQLESNVLNVFRAPYTSNESIFSMPFSATDVPGSSLGNSFLPDGVNATGFRAAGTGNYYLLESGIVANPGWKDTDDRRQFIFRTTTGSATGRLWCTKFDMGSPFADYIPVIRYAQVMLNLAEALAYETTGSADTRAVDLLHAVRNRSDETTTFAPTSQAELLDLIDQERNIEFLGEGIRNIDLVRRLEPIPAKRPAGSSPVAEVQPSAPNYIWPLPTSETIYNQGL
ncbi:RagB/SusD family nutrient uptake outer membrane protein [Sphingobacterium phlebotomi]|nr:RagB/SusD family nutrient uptake outer membrane protein [Sphingobacterium phlebotomi]